jgi:hypothetical protein
MGAGDFPAGVGPAGIDPPAAPTPPRSVVPPHALLFDGATRDVPLDDQGHYEGVHPVDHRVALALFIALGSIPSGPDVGNTLGDVLIQDPDPLQQDVQTRVQAALQDDIDAQNIDLVEVDASAGPRWRLSVRVVYRNLRLPDTPLRTLTT